MRYFGLPAQQIMPTILAAAIIAAIEVAFVLAYATVLLGRNSAFLGPMIGLLLTGVVISIFVIAVMSSYAGSFGTAQDIPASLLSVITINIAMVYGLSDASAVTGYNTIIAALMISTLIAAMVFLLMAWFKLGKTIRFVPFPVIAGVLAGTGWILFMVGLGMLLDQPVDYHNFSILFSHDNLARWVPGVLIGIILLIVSKAVKSPLGVPVAILGVIIFIHLGLIGMEVDFEWAQTLRILLDLKQVNLPFGVDAWGVASQANWSLVAEYWPTILSVCAISALMVMVQVSSLEVVVGQEINVNRELLANGVANLAIGGIGGLISYHHISESSLAYHLGVRNRAAGVL